MQPEITPNPRPARMLRVLRRPQKNMPVRIGAGCLFVMAAPFALGVFGAIIEWNPGGLLICLFLTALLAGGGIYWLKWIRKQEISRESAYGEKVVLDAAAAQGGIVTLAQICHQTSLTIEQAREHADNLCVRGLARIDVLDDGIIVYVFDGLGPIQIS